MSLWRQLWEITKLVPGYAKDLVITFLGGESRSNCVSAGPVRPDEEPT
jgi:hypothetical protein